MKSQHRVFLAVALVALVAAAWYRYSVMKAEAPPPLEPVDIVFVTGGSEEYWQLAAYGARKAAEDFKANVRIEMPTGNESAAEQTKILERVAKTDPGGIAISPLDAAQQTELINALAKGAYVVTFDSDAPDSDRKGYVGTSNFAAGRVLARLAREALPNGGKIAVLLANTTKDNLQDRKGGFQEVLANFAAAPDAPAFDVVGFFTDDGDDARCTTNIRESLKENPDLACFVGMNFRHGPVLRRVLKQDGQLGKIRVIAFDDADETLHGIAAGDFYATVTQDPYTYGYEAVNMLCKLCRGNETQLPIRTTTYSVNVETVRQDNLDDYRSRIKSRQPTPSKKDKADAA